MKKKISQRIHNQIHILFKNLKKSKYYLYFKNKSSFYRGVVAGIFIIYGIVAIIVPFIPMGVVVLLFGCILIFDPKLVRTKLLYIINITRIKYFTILFYVHFIHKMKQYFLKNKSTKKN